MTEEFYFFKQNKDGEFEQYEPYITVSVNTEEDYEFMKQAIEKQKPKKPMPLLNVYPDGQYECSCDCPVLRCYSYCPKCGQKLDWSDIDE